MALLATTPAAMAGKDAPAVVAPGAEVAALAKRQAAIQGIVVFESKAGLRGVAVDIIVTATNDGGETRFEREVGDQMTTSLKEAVRAVQVEHPDWDGQGLRVSFENKYTDKDGGSAGTAYAVCLRSMLEGFDIDPAFAMTGDITVDRRVRKIGGVVAKIDGATRDGARLIGIPSENAAALDDLVILESPRALVDAQLFVLDTLDDAVALARGDRAQSLATAIDLFADLQKQLDGKRGSQGFKDPGVEDQLVAILELAPHHASAQGMLKQIRREAPRRLSVGASFDQILQTAGPAFESIGELKFGVRPTGDQVSAIASGEKALIKLGRLLDKDMRMFYEASKRYVAAGAKMVRSKKPGMKYVQRLRQAGEKLSAEYTKIGRDSEILDALVRGGG